MALRTASVGRILDVADKQDGAGRDVDDQEEILPVEDPLSERCRVSDRAVSSHEDSRSRRGLHAGLLRGDRRFLHHVEDAWLHVGGGEPPGRIWRSLRGAPGQRSDGSGSFATVSQEIRRHERNWSKSQKTTH